MAPALLTRSILPLLLFPAVNKMKPVQTPSAPAAVGTLRIGSGLIARNTVLNLIARVVPLLVGVAAMPYVIHHLGPDRFGILSLAWMVVGYFALFDIGIGPATTKFVADILGKGESQELPGVVWTALTSQTCFGLVAGILLAAMSPLLVGRVLKIPVELQSQAHLVFLIIAFSLPISFASGSLRGVLAASQRFDLLSAISIPSSALTYLLPVGALFLGFGLPVIVACIVLARVAAVGVLLALCVNLYPALRVGFRFNRRLLRSLLGYGGWVTVSGVISPILVYFDRFLIGAVVSISAVGFYTPPYEISTKLWILPGSLTATLFPAFSTSAARGDIEWVRAALIRSFKLLLLLVGPAALVLIFFARPLLTLWLGTKFASEGSLPLQILCVGVFVSSLAYVPYNLLYGVGRPDLPAKFHLLEVPLHIGLAWFLVTRMGLAGAALAWTTRSGLDLLMLSVAACRVTRTSPRLLAGKGLGRSVFTLLALSGGFSILWVSNRAPVIDILLATLLSGGFLLAAWHYVLNFEEKWKIRLWLKIER